MPPEYQKIVDEIYTALEGLNAPPLLLGIVGSWGDTLTDEEVHCDALQETHFDHAFTVPQGSKRRAPRLGFQNFSARSVLVSSGWTRHSTVLPPQKDG